MLHNGAYIALILYISLSKPVLDYITGLVQNILIILMKHYYKVYGTTDPEPAGVKGACRDP